MRANFIQHFRPIITLVLLSVISADVLTAADFANSSSWPQWRGPSRDGQIRSTAWPNSLAPETLQRVWRVPLGPSYSGPIVVDDRVFVTETRDAKFEVVRALNRNDGQQTWETEWEGAMQVPFFARSNGDWIRSTPASDGERLYVAGMRDVLVCLDSRTGETLWRRDFVKELGTPTPSFGFASSPLLVGDYVYVQAGGAFLKLDKATGKIVWKALEDAGGMNGSAFSSPYFTTIRQTPQILVQTRTSLAGVDPESGSVLWSQDIPAFRGMNILTPTVTDNTVFTSSYGGRSFLFDTQKDGESWRLDEAWTNKAQGYMSSPIVVGDHLYLHLRNQRFTCIDSKTGEARWTTKTFGKYWSMVANGDQILALDQRGDLLLIRANSREFELIDSRKISDDETWAHLAVCGDEVFVRELNAISVYRWK